MPANLNILIDTSASMNELLSNKSELTKMDYVVEKLFFILDNIKFQSITLYSFNTEVETIGTFRKTNSALKKCKTLKPNGGTKIWDSISEVIDMIDVKTDDVQLICITDGEDGAPAEISASVIEKAVRKNIELRVVDVSGKRKKSVDSNENYDDQIIIGDSLDHFPQSLKRTLTTKQAIRPMNISTPILPLIKIEEHESALINKAMKLAIPYLEHLTNLRYYPVPTVIVEEYTINKEYPVDPFDQDQSSAGAYQLSAIHEVFRFIYAAITKMSIDGFKDSLGISIWDADSLVKDLDQSVLELAEDCGGLPLLLEELIQSGDLSADNPNLKTIFISQFSKKRDPLRNISDNIFKLIGILKDIEALYPGKILYSISDFDIDCNPLGIAKMVGSEPDYSNSNVWIYQLKDKELQMQIYKDGSNGGGTWNKSLKSIISVTEIAVPLIIKLISQYLRVCHTFSGIIKEAHTYGVYIENPSRSLREDLDRLFLRYPCPQHTGMVLICLERIKKSLEKYSESELIDNDLIWGVIASTLVHEHTHAILSEGIDQDIKSSVKPAYKTHSDEAYSIIHESLAEWSELNFFRNDKVIYDIIYQHAESGDFPSWPYYGALYLENSFKLNDYSKFRSLVTLLRNNPEEAYRLLQAQS